MGSDPETDIESFDDGKPRHEVSLPAFYIARYPVTVAQFCQFTDERGSFLEHDSYRRLLKKRSNHPIVGISWNGAMEYCRW